MLVVCTSKDLEIARKAVSRLQHFCVRDLEKLFMGRCLLLTFASLAQGCSSVFSSI